jgi:hypothetical protein
VFVINENLGWNDIRVISFKPGKGCNDEEHEEIFVATLRELDKTISRSVVVGGIGGYGVDADDLDYYLVQWTEEPRMIEDDNVLLVGDTQIQMQVLSVNWVCNGRWLNQVHRAKIWYTVGDVSVPVRMQNVLSANLDMTTASQENPLPRMSQAVLDNIMLLHPIKLDVLDHDFMMDELFC